MTTLNLQPGEALVLYTDGIIEAMNWAAEPFGYGRWQQTIEKKLGSNTSASVASLLDDMRAHTGGRSVDDDLTILILQTK